MIDLPETANITLEVHPAREATKNVSLVVGGSSTYDLRGASKPFIIMWKGVTIFGQDICFLDVD